MAMVDLVEASRGALFDAIAAGLVGSGFVARDHVKQDSDPRFVQIGDIEWTNEGGKDDVTLRLIFDVVTVYRGADRAELLAVMHRNFLALHGVELEADGVVLRAAELIGGSASNAASDGVTYAGLQSFEICVEPA